MFGESNPQNSPKNSRNCILQTQTCQPIIFTLLILEMSIGEIYLQHSLPSPPLLLLKTRKAQALLPVSVSSLEGAL